MTLKGVGQIPLVFVDGILKGFLTEFKLGQSDKPEAVPGQNKHLGLYGHSASCPLDRSLWKNLIWVPL